MYMQLVIPTLSIVAVRSILMGNLPRRVGTVSAAQLNPQIFAQGILVWLGQVPLTSKICFLINNPSVNRNAPLVGKDYRMDSFLVSVGKIGGTELI